jgi:hypothetical protein
MPHGDFSFNIAMIVIVHGKLPPCSPLSTDATGFFLFFSGLAGPILPMTGRDH